MLCGPFWVEDALKGAIITETSTIHGQLVAALYTTTTGLHCQDHDRFDHIQCLIVERVVTLDTPEAGHNVNVTRSLWLEGVTGQTAVHPLL